ncbi:MAG TPA: hypothetical protein PLQ54_09920, partial [Armatimonadota bacterium]|nr:hypothetical protein [Armatimonadota bacterium]
MTTTDTTLTPINFADVKTGDRIRIEYQGECRVEDVVQTRNDYWLDCSITSFPKRAGMKLYLLDRPDDEATLRAKRARLAYWEACGEPRHSEPKEASLNAWKAALGAADDDDAPTKPKPEPRRVEVGDKIRITRLSTDGFYSKTLQVGMVGTVTDDRPSCDGYWAIQEVNFHPVRYGGYLIQDIRPGDFEIVTWKPIAGPDIKIGDYVRMTDRQANLVI